MYKVLFFIGVVAIQFSCERTIYGCTDKHSPNFNEKANTSDNSCNYDVEGIFFFEEDIYQDFLASNVELVTMYVDGNLIVEDFDLLSYAVPNLYEASCDSNPEFYFNENVNQSNKKVLLTIYNQDDSLLLARRYGVVQSQCLTLPIY